MVMVLAPMAFLMTMDMESAVAAGIAGIMIQSAALIIGNKIAPHRPSFRKSRHHAAAEAPFGGKHESVLLS